MAWIEFHEGLRDHWKIHRLSLALKIEYPAALGHISLLWLWCVQNSPKGDVSRFTNEEICRAMGLKNCEKDIKNTLIECELLNESGKIHDWHKHGVSLMLANRKRVQEFRKKKQTSNITEALPLRSTNLTQPNLTKPINNTSGKPDFSQPILYLNEKTGRNYDPKSPSNLKFVMARFKAGKTFSDFKAVIDKKVAEWKGTEWEVYLRPETLFNATKFESYLNQPVKESPEFQAKMAKLGVK